MSLFNDVTNKPWNHVGLPDGIEPKPVFSSSDASIALTIFLIIVSVIFSLFLVAYFIRMELGDWVPLALPGQLWLNTAALLGSSVFMQLAVLRNYRQTNTDFSSGAGLMFFIGGVLAIAFIAGQYLVWDSLVAAGQGVRSNPANAFFFLLTAVHAVHLLGGLWVWSRALFRIANNIASPAIQQSMKLCAVYWHFLLLIWVGLFVLLSYT